MEPILIGTTDRTILVFIPDPASTTGAGKTGLNAAALTCTYTRVETDNDVVHNDVTSSLNDLSALTDAHNDWGVKEVNSTLSKGLYRLDLADAVFASGAWYAVVQVTITSGTAAATPKAFQLVAYNPLDAAALGLTNLNATISSRATPAEVNAEVLDVLNVDTFAEPGQATPAATTTLQLKLSYLYKAWRNKKTQTASQYSLFNDDASTIDQKAAVSDDTTTTTIGEVATGP